MRDIERVALLHRIDGFVFSAMVAEDALNIWNAANQVEIAKEQ